jgi:pyrroline-5-carboxylate reductase
MKIGVVGAAGWLGGSIVRAMLAGHVVEPSDLTLSYRSKRVPDFAGAHWTTDSQALADRSEIVIVSVRPEDLGSVSFDARGKPVISVMAGIRLGQLADRFGTRRVVRCMPNAAAEVEKSYTPWVAADAVTESDRAAVNAIFGACGVCDEVAREADLEYLTGLSGSGPAFPALLAAAMMSDAVSHGIAPRIARRAVTTLLVGTGRLLEKSGESPADTVETFVSYRGTTAAAIEAMKANGFNEAVSAGLTAALEKSARMAEAPEPGSA